MIGPDQVHPTDGTINWSLFAGAETVKPGEVTIDGSSSERGTSTNSTDEQEHEEELTINDREHRSKNERVLDGSSSTNSIRKRKGDKWAPKTIGFPRDPNDWLWMMSEEPHRSRRRAILKDHPEVKNLMGHSTSTKWIVLFVVCLQISISIYFGKSTSSSIWSWKFWSCAYLIGATANQNLFLAIHEISHNLAFKSIKANRCLAIFANLPIFVPYSMLFKPYHLEHHKNLGEDGIDTDLPTRLELVCLKNVLAGSLHPCAAHFIAEHYIWEKGGEQETWSYYGPLNCLTYNVGYHNEHHDFPSVAWNQLPKLRQIAHDYYDPLPSHPSWPMVTFNFIFNPKVGLFSRVKRHPNKKS